MRGYQKICNREGAGQLQRTIYNCEKRKRYSDENNTHRNLIVQNGYETMKLRTDKRLETNATKTDTTKTDTTKTDAASDTRGCA